MRRSGLHLRLLPAGALRSVRRWDLHQWLLPVGVPRWVRRWGSRQWLLPAGAPRWVHRSGSRQRLPQAEELRSARPWGSHPRLPRAEEPPSERRSEPQKPRAPARKAQEASEHQTSRTQHPQRQPPWCPQCTCERYSVSPQHPPEPSPPSQRHRYESAKQVRSPQPRSAYPSEENGREPTHSYQTPPRAHRAGSPHRCSRYRAPSTQSHPWCSNAANPPEEPARRYPLQRPCAEPGRHRNHQRRY